MLEFEELRLKIEARRGDLDELRGARYFGELLRVDCTDFSYQSDEGLLEKIKVFLNN